MKLVKSLVQRTLLHFTNVEKTPYVPRKDEKVRAKIDSIYDADTIKVVFMNGLTPVKYSIRVFGIDAPEIRCKNKWETEAACAARDYVRHMILGKSIKVQILKHDKYGGRLVGRVYFDGYDLSTHLLNMGFVKAYGGKKKEPWTREECALIVKKVAHRVPNYPMETTKKHSTRSI